MHGREFAQAGDIVYVGTNRVMTPKSVGKVLFLSIRAKKAYLQEIDIELMNGETSTQWTIYTSP